MIKEECMFYNFANVLSFVKRQTTKDIKKRKESASLKPQNSETGRFMVLL